MKTVGKIFIVVVYLSMTTYFSFQWIYNQPTKTAPDDKGAAVVDESIIEEKGVPNWKRKYK